MSQITITTNGTSKGLALSPGDHVVELGCSNWSGATATLKRYIDNDTSYVVQDVDGDVVFGTNGGIVVPGNAVYFVEVAGYTNPIIFKAS